MLFQGISWVRNKIVQSNLSIFRPVNGKKLPLCGLKMFSSGFFHCVPEDVVTWSVMVQDVHGLGVIVEV